jgi:hypothetical protein
MRMYPCTADKPTSSDLLPPLGVNPGWGQGITKAMCDSTYLSSTLANLVPPWSTGLPAHFSKEFLKRATPCSRSMYDQNRMLDYGFHTTIPQAGESLQYGAWFRWYWDGLLRVCCRVSGISPIVVLPLRRLIYD